jgi:putative aminopeptidase FrvX
MHTTVEMAEISDVEATITLIYETLLRLSPKFDFKYLRVG